MQLDLCFERTVLPLSEPFLENAAETVPVRFRHKRKVVHRLEKQSIFA